MQEEKKIFEGLNQIFFFRLMNNDFKNQFRFNPFGNIWACVPCSASIKWAKFFRHNQIRVIRSRKNRNNWGGLHVIKDLQSTVGSRDSSQAEKKINYCCYNLSKCVCTFVIVVQQIWMGWGQDSTSSHKKVKQYLNKFAVRTSGFFKAR